MRIGNGYDVHRLVAGRKLILGGVEIEWHLGLEGHSDADVVLHALCDALLGAAGLGDIGRHFPPSNEKYRDYNSRHFVRHVAELLKQEGFIVQNVDLTIVAERPKLADFLPVMAQRISQDLAIACGQVNVKATTTEGLGFCGTEEGIACFASALLKEPLNNS